VERTSKRTIFNEDQAINAQGNHDDDLPVLTEAIELTDTAATRPSAAELVKLESKICAHSLTLADQMLHEACQDAEDMIVERVMSKLRSELPALVSRVLHDHFHGKE
jgi:hypothetical protein